MYVVCKAKIVSDMMNVSVLGGDKLCPDNVCICAHIEGQPLDW